MGTEGLSLNGEKLEETCGFVTSFENGESDRALNISLTFDLSAIAFLLSEFPDFFATDSQFYRYLEYYSQTLLPNNSTLQEKFTLLLLESLIDQPQETIVT
ncbi:hypothetical protein [Brunnivagina elsteri]|uniref:Uncharacterized protein n=1 Tax=Brunnivagina elsteri CCALA 953 TaxID=987040 RepID=A0A2A2TJN9_9CYAN|nr:hypothetical protein [Calothrix elsteri]PAX55126.1 hypothetical protein CK510_11640 [Calothrix elsteri CCALA 953]